MLFNSLEFMCFFPIVVIGYYLIPQKYKNIWLLILSYYFYMGWNAKYALLLLFSTIITYFSGRLLDYIYHKDILPDKIIKYRKLVVACSFMLNLGVLFFYKYTNFVAELITRMFVLCHIDFSISRFDILLPVGISFFTFQALSYTMDVYRGDIYAEHNFLRYALYVSFFPQLVAGPIERSKNLLKQLASPNKFDFNKVRDGLLLMIWGYFLKIVLADRISILVDTVYGDYNSYPGWYLIVATILFAVQIYCDFAGYSTIAVGAAEILGIHLLDNFRAPYLATNVSDFWRRWHISLTSWFRDYLYIPLGGNQNGTLRKYANILIVFLCSGLWHGASFSFIVWGGLNGLYQIIGKCLMPYRQKIIRIFHMNCKSEGFKICQIVTTFVLVDFSWIFFRASSMSEAKGIIKSILRADNISILFDGSLYNLGLSEKSFQIMLIAIVVLLLSDIAKNFQIKIREVIARQDFPIRCFIIVFVICFILTVGIWGPAYSANNFIYFQF